MPLTITPLGDKVLVRVLPHQPTQTASGLVVSHVDQHLVWATVQTVGEDCRWVESGQQVLVNPIAGREIGDDLVLPETAVLATR